MASRNTTIDYYDILGVPRNAAREEIAAAYRQRIIQLRDLPGSGAESRQINLAYRALSNPERRRSYDESLGILPSQPVIAPEDHAPAAGFEAPEGRGPDEPTEEPRYFQEQPTEQAWDEQPRRRRGPLVLIAAVLLLSLLLAGAWASGLFDTQPRVADRGGAGGASPGTDGAAGQQAEKGGVAGSIVDAIASLSPIRRDEDPVAAAAAGQGEEAPVTPAAPGDTEPPTTAASADEVPPATEPSADTPVEEPAAREPEPEPAAPPQEAPAPAPQPAPQPRADLSAAPRLLAGGLRDSDNRGGRFSGSVAVRLFVTPGGRAQGCRVTRSSGNASLDVTTCRLLQERLVFSPARDRDGRAIASVVDSTHVWGSRRRR